MKRILTGLVLAQIFLLVYCGAGNHSNDNSELKIRLRWVKAYPKESWTAVKTGFFWSLSYLGAALDSSEQALIHRIDSSVFEVNLSKAGFPDKSLNALRTIVSKLQSSEEYSTMNAIDLGRFIVATQHISEHYYAITDAAPTLQAFLQKHDFNNAKEYVVAKSCVAKHHRILRCRTGKNIDEIAFIAEEGLGSPDSGNFKVTAYEVFDVMKNGQLRFSIYDAKGQRIIGSPREMGEAGKPSKCIWCHESNVQILFFDTPDVKNYMTKNEFMALVKTAQDTLDHYRNNLKKLIDFRHTQDHTYSELLYISFMEPSVPRLMNEWNLDSVGVSMRMKSQQEKHIYSEFPFLGQLYHRYYADSLSPFKSVKMPLSVREPLGTEPSLLDQ